MIAAESIVLPLREIATGAFAKVSGRGCASRWRSVGQRRFIRVPPASGTGRRLGGFIPQGTSERIHGMKRHHLIAATLVSAGLGFATAAAADCAAELGTLAGV